MSEKLEITIAYTPAQSDRREAFRDRTIGNYIPVTIRATRLNMVAGTAPIALPVEATVHEVAVGELYRVELPDDQHVFQATYSVVGVDEEDFSLNYEEIKYTNGIWSSRPPKKLDASTHEGSGHAFEFALGSQTADSGTDANQIALVFCYYSGNYLHQATLLLIVRPALRPIS